MISRRMLVHGLALLGPGAAAAPSSPSTPPSAPVTPAERLLFFEPHLKGIEPPFTLRYRYLRTGAKQSPLEDEVRIELSARPGGGCCQASGQFLSGANTLALPTVGDARSNPVILYFLEHDVREMQRLTQGQEAHFRRRIRLALAGTGATLRDTTVRHAGRDWPAQEIGVKPYLDDPHRARFERYAGKAYRFVLAAGLPGGVYQLQTSVPGNGDSPLLEETVTLAER